MAAVSDDNYNDENVTISEKWSEKLSCDSGCNCDKKEAPFSISKDDFEVTYFTSNKYVNKHMNCVRIKHKKSGVMKIGQNSKSIQRNREDAFTNLLNDQKFKVWMKNEIKKLVIEEK